MGPGWYFNRERWATWDGYAPYDVVWRAWKTLGMARAMDRIVLTKATRDAPAPAESLMPILDALLKEALGG
jgi:hypothetical protein